MQQSETSPSGRVGALVLAAGSGTRMGTAKQFLELEPQQRLVDRTVAAVAELADWIGLVLPADHAWRGARVDAIVAGGDSRHASLANGLGLVPDDVDVVVVHSASHPLATPELVAALVARITDGADAAVPFLPAADVIKRRAPDGTLTTVGRESLGAAQCPMAFARPMLDRAFAEAEPGIEESALVEAIGGVVAAEPGESANVHVIDAATLAIARDLVCAEASRSGERGRVGS
ncbi:MAG: 2-C-methyl-D-erythritol 4-phosphate cytidylyltransferase [Acidimicrobiales bacterium]